MRRARAAVLCVLAACGSEAGPAGPDQAAAYGDWVRKQIPTNFAGAGGVNGRIAVLLPQGRSKRAGDFIEVALNGQRLRKVPFGGPTLELSVTLGPGINILDLYDSTSEKSCRRHVDAREGTDFTFQPTADGYDLVQRASD